MLSTVPSVRAETESSKNNYNKDLDKVIEDASNDIINKVEIIDGSDSTTEKMVNSFNELMFKPTREYIDSHKYQSKSSIKESPDIFRAPPRQSSKDLQELTQDQGQSLISIDKNDKRFNFYDKSQVYLGSFSIDELIKYIAHKYDPKGQFLPSINAQVYNEAVNIINKMIGSMKYNKSLKYAYIDLLDYINSPFMGDINYLVKLNNILHKTE